jgi:hypothetical protein
MSNPYSMAVSGVGVLDAETKKRIKLDDSLLAEYRETEFELANQVAKQSIWLRNNQNDERYAQRFSIWEARKAELNDLRRRTEKLINDLWDFVGTIEDPVVKEKVSAEILRFEEPPF